MRGQRLLVQAMMVVDVGRPAHLLQALLGGVLMVGTVLGLPAFFQRMSDFPGLTRREA